MAVQLILEHGDLRLEVRVPERRPQEEAVELRLRQRERSLVLDRVLGRDHEEGIRKRSRDAVARDLPLGHRLEERRLRLRDRAVDLVDEHDVREHRAGPELEVASALVEHREARDVGRLEIGRALDSPGARALDRLCERASEHGLRGSRDVFEQDVAAARESRDDEANLSRLAVDDGLDVSPQTVGGLVGRRRIRTGVGRLHAGQDSHARGRKAPSGFEPLYEALQASA